MAENSITHILCPGCDSVVQGLDAVACPDCGLCPYCGCKLKTKDERCDCDVAQDPEKLTQFLEKFGIPAERVAIETYRMEVRKKLETKKHIVGGLLVGILMLPGIVFGNILRDGTWTTWWVYIFSISTVFMLLGWFARHVFQKIEDHHVKVKQSLSDETQNTT